MSKTRLLLDLARDLSSLADSVRSIADAMVDNEPAAEPEATMEREPVAKPVTLEQVRMVLADKSQKGCTAEVRTLLEKYGAPKLSQIDPANYAELLQEAEALGNG